MIVTQGLNDVIDTTFATPRYIGLFASNYTPLAGHTMTTIGASAGETGAYDEATRQEFIESVASAGSTDNTGNVAVFTFNANVTVYGAFLCTIATKGTSTGRLLGAVRFAQAMVMKPQGVLYVPCELFFTQPV